VKTSARGLLAALAASVLISAPALANSTESRAEISKVVRVNGTIVDVAASNPAFSKLVTALTAANLVGVLQGPGPFTVYAPTDAAFDKVPAPLLNLLLSDPSGALTSVLTYHVTPGIQDLRFSFVPRATFAPCRAMRSTPSVNATRCSSTIRASSAARS
jgi:uncharacterized surface protein with fasciclin (FAS1) repeats